MSKPKQSQLHFSEMELILHYSVTNVSMSDGAGVYEEITVYKIPPEGEIMVIDI